jgi:hypothetical protein
MSSKKLFAKFDLKGVLSKRFSVSDIVGCAFLISIVLGLPYFVFFASEKLILQSDIVSFITGALMLREKVGVNTYDLETQLSYQNQIVAPFIKEEVLPFKNFMLFAIPFYPLTRLPLRTSYIDFALFNLILLGILTFKLKTIFRNIKKFRLWFLAPFIFIPNILTVILGQLSIVLFFIYLFIYKYIKEGRGILSGVFSGFLLIKPQYIIAVPFFLMLSKEKRRFLTGFLATSFVIMLSSLLLSGFESILKYPSFLILSENEFFAGNSQRMLTIGSTLHYGLFEGVFNFRKVLYLNFALYILIFVIFLARYRKARLDLSFAAATIFSLLFAVHVLEHDLSILLVPALITLDTGLRYGLRELHLILTTLIFILPLIVLIVSPLAGTFIALFIAVFLLSQEKMKRSLSDLK